MGPKGKVQTLPDTNNQTNTLVGCEYWVTKVLARKWWKTPPRRESAKSCSKYLRDREHRRRPWGYKENGFGTKHRSHVC